MMLGIAASISMAVPSGRRSHTGESSVKKIEMPKLTGMAMSSAIAEVTSVPTIGTSAPKSSLTGSQFSFHKKPRPNFSSDNREPMRSETRIAASRLKTRKAKKRVRLRNTASINALLRSTGGMGERSIAAADLSAVAILPRSSTALIGFGGKSTSDIELRSVPGPGKSEYFPSVDCLAGRVGHHLPRRLDFLHHRLGHRHVVELVGHLRAVLERPVEELEHFAAGLGLFLLRVHEDEGGARDRPALLADLVGQDHTHAGNRFPVRAGGGGLEGEVVGPDELARLVLTLSVRE